MNKIAVYTICKNEEKFVNKWLDSMSEADYMVVLDTGSTDATIKLLEEGKKKYPNLIYAQKVIDPWRFDVARNANIDIIPKDANISITGVLLKSASNADILSEFKEKANLDILGAESYLAASYRIWIYEPAALDSTEIYTITLG